MDSIFCGAEKDGIPMVPTCYCMYGDGAAIPHKEFVMIKNIVVGLLGLVFVLGLLGFLFFGAKLTDVILPMIICAVGIVALELYYNRDSSE
jgi:hypothetical protein